MLIQTKEALRDEDRKEVETFHARRKIQSLEYNTQKGRAKREVFTNEQWINQPAAWGSCCTGFSLRFHCHVGFP